MNLENKIVYDGAVDNLLISIGNAYDKWNNPMVSDDKHMVKIKKESAVRFKDGLKVKSGRKFDKIVENNSVWGFVAKKDGVLKGIPYLVGDVFKPASWSAPAKHVRGSIFDNSTEWFDWTGPNYLI